MNFQLPKLQYSYKELEPYIDRETMEIHYSKHHQAYTDNFNKLIGEQDIKLDTAEEYLKNLNKFEETIANGIRNNGGGYVNHNLFWEIMSPNPQKEPSDNLMDSIVNKFNSLENFKEIFEKSALTRFGSGWAWLVINNDKELEVYSTANQDSPYSKGHLPLMGIDVWEHAYYLRYQNKRADYIKNWWNVLDWGKISDKYESLI